MACAGYLKETFIANPPYMTPLMTPIHIVSELSRIISLSMRLFGNVFAGEILLAVMLALTFAIVPVASLDSSSSSARCRHSCSRC